MAQNNEAPRGAVDAEFRFVVPPTDGRSAFVNAALPKGEGYKLSGTEAHRMPLIDIRAHEQQYGEVTHGFQPVQNVSSATTYETFDSESEVKRVYYPEIESLLLQTLGGAHSVVVLGHCVRKQNDDSHYQPVNFVHSDHTLQAAEEIARKHAGPEKTAELLQGRFRIFSVWRPLNGLVQSTPLAFASAASVGEDDAFPVDFLLYDRVSAVTGFKYNPQQQWFYWSGMENNERLLLTLTDNASEVGNQSPHTAFSDPRTPSDAKYRESVEVRALVFG